MPLTTANPNPDGYINPILEWDTNNPIDGIAWSGTGFGKDNHLFGAVYGILDTGPESLEPTWPAVLDIEFLEPSGIKWSYFARNVEMGPNAYQKPGEPGWARAPERCRVPNDGRTMYIVDYGEVFTDFEMPLAVLHRAQVRRDLELSPEPPGSSGFRGGAGAGWLQRPPGSAVDG